MPRYFPPQRNFHSLSVRDLLDARDAYHVHLAHLTNVIATAIGRYRIRKTDPDTTAPDKRRNRAHAPERTLHNSVVREWSWPCLLVFVQHWCTQEELSREPDQVVPRFLYMPDGRVVPTCVILAEKQEYAPPPLRDLAFPSALGGGGYPILTRVQGQEHVGSLGCLVTDGDTIYGLTNRHVTGEAQREIFTLINGEHVEIGRSDRKQIGKKRFQDVYRGWADGHTCATIDAGLIRLADVNGWTSQVFGIGELDEPVDLNTDTISLDLIGCPVRAFGGASGELIGEIQALFYRYQSLGGVDYVSDLLIGPRSGDTPMDTRPGDSGTLWFYDPDATAANTEPPPRGLRARRLRPIALQWGGHTLLDGSEESELHFALATCLSTVCRELDVAVVRDWNIGHPEYWGKVGHYKIAAKSCELVSDTKLKKLLTANLDRIAFGDAAIEAGDLKKIVAQQFVPLADVPDLVWRTMRPADAGNHFADMDQPGTGEFKNKTLLALCQDPANVSVAVWNAFYDSIGAKKKRGALPFRVWEIYDAMVGFARHGDVAKFVCAAGVLAHYIADACQALHVSRLYDGDSNHPDEAGVHTAYETKMLERFAAEVIAGVNAKLKNSKAKPDLAGGHAAAVSVVELMRRSLKKLPPKTIIEAFVAQTGREQIPHMWKALGDRTAACMADGCLRLAAIWGSAWKEGKGGAISDAKLTAIGRPVLKKLYSEKSFIPSRWLQDMGS